VRKVKTTIFYAIRTKINLTKRLIQASRAHFILCTACSFLGVLIAILIPQKTHTSSQSFIWLISEGQFNPVTGAIWLVVFSLLPFVVVSFSRYGFFLFWTLGYGVILIASILIWRSAFISVSVSAFYGVLYIILFIIPVFIIELWSLSCTLNCIYEMCGLCNHKRSYVTLRFSTLFSAMKSFLFTCLAFNVLWWAILSIIFSCIFA
jgi:hypothetical protein